MKLGESLYKAQQAQQAGRTMAARARVGRRRRPGGPAADDKVVDADFEEVDDQKKRGSA